MAAGHWSIEIVKLDVIGAIIAVSNFVLESWGEPALSRESYQWI